ncbi:hypothetical protein [Ferrovibrio terrae]|uniref:hypothetical protein n=1 Tax=Ferrovibrio terrae TaxID=2594003 RepID=UPI003137DA7E
MKRALLLLAAPSRESQDKAAHFSVAAEKLGLSSRTIIANHVDHAMAAAGQDDPLFVLSCSDALAVAAAMLNERGRSGGLSAALTAHLVDKATGIPALSRVLDLPLLPQCLPLTAADIRNWTYAGAIIVKPTRSAGSWSPRPWGYRRFPTAPAFLHWLEQEGHAESFFAEQRCPTPLGPAVLQAALDSDRVESATLMLTPTRAHILYQGYGDFEPDTMTHGDRRWRRSGYHDGAAAVLADRLPRIELMRRQMPGWGRTLLNVQGIRGPEGFHLTDVNIRITTGWDWVMGCADPDWHTHMLAALLFDTPFERAMPAAAMAVDLLHGEPLRQIAMIEHPALPSHILPLRLTAADCASAAQGFDKAGVAPGFITLASDSATCVARAEAFRSGIRVSYAAEAAA